MYKTVRKTRINAVVFLSFLLFSTGLMAQEPSVDVSGVIKEQGSGAILPFVNVVLKNPLDSSFVSGTITNENGLFTLAEVKPGDYLIESSYIGYAKYLAPLFVGSNSQYIDLGAILMAESAQQLTEVVVTATQDAVNGGMAKKTYAVEDNVSQGGGSVLQSMSNLPGVTTQDGQVQLRGNNQVMVLIDGKQTAMTGFGNQNGLDNIPATAVEKIEIINNPSAKYDANGNAGKSYNTGLEVVISQELTDRVNMNLNLNGYYNQIDDFTVVNQYPVENSFTAEQQEVYSGNIKLNTNFKFANNTEAQLTAIYLAPDIIPQGTIASRFSLDAGVKTSVQKGKGELFLNATDLLNTMVVRRDITGNNFTYTSTDYYETQVIRLGYSYKI